jgi:hypothetical protein
MLYEMNREGIAPTAATGGPSVAVRPGTRPRRYRLRLAVNAAQAFATCETLSKLADAAEHMRVTIEVVAEQPAGFDQVWVRNAVIEPLEEANIQVEARPEE